MEKGISYLNRTFSDYKDALIEFSKKYYPDLSIEYDDASVASWLIDMNAAVADNLSYHIDRVYQETNLDSAQQRESLLNLAINSGVKIPGPKGAMAEVRFTCVLPPSGSHPDWGDAPIIKRGTKVSSSAGQEFEVLEDVDFAQQFNQNGVSDRTLVPNLNSNGIVTGYTVSKLSVVTAGESLIYRQNISANDVKPFMEVVLPVENIMNIESVITVDGNNSVAQHQIPTYSAFYSPSEECDNGFRFFEVDSLAQQEIWTDSIDPSTNRARKYYYGYDADGSQVKSYCVTKGEWKPVKHKFITEYTSDGYMKLIFGAGVPYDYPEIGSTMSEFAKWQISRTINNDSLGVLPNPNSIMFILYRVGGGSASNVAKGAINRISYLNAEFRNNASVVKRTLEVVNTTPSVSGKDFPSNAEIKHIIKYHNASQERCVGVKDYIDRILQLPPKYGTPFRVGVVEQNNKIVVYLLGINYLGQLDTLLPITLIKNIENYLAHYKMINDYVEIKSGRIINLEFQVDVIVDKNYNKTDVIQKIISTIKSYMDINSHIMGEEIYVGDIEKEISKLDGVLNLIDLAVYNRFGAGYSSTQVSQPIVVEDDRNTTHGNAVRIDLNATDGVLYNEGDTMMEIKYPEVDIMVRIKER